jgi:sulfate permease, SulP family
MQNSTSLKRWIPILSWLPSYKSTFLKGDLTAGLTVAVMLIPQGMAYAVLAGLPPVYGLYASTIPLILYAIFGTSRELAVGPVAMVSLIVFAGIGALAEPGSDRFIQLALLATLGVGVVQFLMGVFRMGFLVNFLSHPVLSGFTSAAAIIIGASQIKSLLGLEMPGSMPVLETLYTASIQIGTLHVPTALIGLGSVVTIIALRSWKKAFPSALVVVIVGTTVVSLFGLEAAGVSIVGTVPVGFPSLTTPAFSIDDLTRILPVVLVISLVGYMESIAIAKAIANKKQYKIDSNQELIGLGAANIGGAFFQSFPVTGGLSRTAVNNQAGATTPLAAIISAALVAITVAFLTPLFYFLPKSVLAAIIIVAVSTLFDVNAMKHLWHTDRRDLALLVITFAATLLLGIENGIALGVIMSLIIVIYNTTKPHSAELGRLGDSENFRNVNRYPNAQIDPDVIVFRFDSPLYFASSNAFMEQSTARIKMRNPRPTCFILDASSINFLDSTGIHALEELLTILKSQNINLVIAGAIGPVRDMLKQSGIMDQIGSEKFFFDVSEAFENRNRSNTSFLEHNAAQTNFTQTK